MKKFCYDFPRPGLTVDAVIYSYFGSKLQLLLIERGIEPYMGCWALPGGFVNKNENVYQAVEREIEEETNLRIKSFEPFYFASEPGRDPRGWTVSLVFIGTIGKEHRKARAGDDARNLSWFPVNELPSIAFDHTKIIEKSRDFLLDVAGNKVVNSNLLPNEFSVKDIINLHNEIGFPIDIAEKIVKRLIETKILENANNGLYRYSAKGNNNVKKVIFPRE